MSTLDRIVIEHHKQAARETKRYLNARRSKQGPSHHINLLRHFGRRYTTRVERRLRNLDSKGRLRSKQQ